MEYCLISPCSALIRREAIVLIICHSLFASCFKAMAGAAQELEEKLEVAAHVAGVVQVTGTLGPTQMMLCKADLSDKHERWFRIDADESTIEWSKQAAEGKLVLPTKGPFQVRAPPCRPCQPCVSR